MDNEVNKLPIVMNSEDVYAGDTKAQFDITNMIHIVRGQQIMLDSDLAMLYQVETKVLNQAAKRNIALSR